MNVYQERKERQRQRQREQMEELRRSAEQTLEIQRRQQESINRTLEQGRPQPSITVPAPAAPERTAPSFSPSSKPDRAAPITASALAGTPNDEGPGKKGWSRWQLVSHDIWVSFADVNRNGKGSKPLWTWMFKNWSDRDMKTIWFEYWDDGKWNKDLNPTLLKSRGAHGGWGSFTATGTQPPQLRITSVDYK